MGTADGYEKVTLANLAQGAAVERFDAELQRVLENIADINTKCKQKRKIVLEVEILPSNDRSVGAVAIKCSSKLAGLDIVDHTVQFGMEGKRQAAFQRNDHQGELDFENANNKVTPIGEKAKAPHA